MGIGKSIQRVDARAKVTGQAKYTQDLMTQPMMVAKVVHSTVANGVVTGFDLDEALKVPGVIKIVTCFDVPEIDFCTPGHPWSVEAAHQDVQDRRLLNQRVRYYGDDVAAVIAEDEIAAVKAARLVKVHYEEYPALVDVADAMAEGAVAMHDNVPDNILKHTSFALGEENFDEAVKEKGLILVDQTYDTQRVQHCHIELPVSFAYQDGNGKITVTTSTQIPHIVRRVIGQALGIPWGQVRVIKPYIGGGFGNKQDVLYEPLNAFLSLQVGGRPVKLELTREETFADTRVRHAIRFHMQGAVRPDGTLVARRVEAFSNQGGYASHGHAIVANASNMIKQLYRDEKALESESYTVYTSTVAGGAMRGYGIPQGDFAAECLMDDLAAAIHMDPLAFRLKNCMEEGYKDPHNGITFYSYGLKKCIEAGKEAVHWDEKRAAYVSQTGSRRRGIGMAIFCYKTGVYPISLETATCRMVLNQDGSIQLMMGATEIGQGADTVFTQMAAEVLGVTEDKVYIVSTQDTDVTPFDTGAYASRQSYVSGKAVKKTAEMMKEKILEYAAWKLKMDQQTLDIRNNMIVTAEGEELLTMEALATEALYSLERSVHITAEATSHCKENTFASGACFAEVEVDMPLGKVNVLKIINVHDSGILMNPKLAEAQVHGGMSMGLGYGLSEELMYDAKGKPLNNNLLDYKLPTAMDTPELNVEFIELQDPTGPFGNKALGEPPAIPVAPAIRNAVLQATGIGFNQLPMEPQRLVAAFKEKGLI
uniref:xanthine dehydrogenase subunit XdhA n=1 Tax=Coprococcus catus TaxID=116085 RepID=UPI0022E0D5BB|nr:xanthine dehydrogenase subunit XdhA [Coprococcus catus]